MEGNFTFEAVAAGIMIVEYWEGIWKLGGIDGIGGGQDEVYI